jgi:hypothetical protein
MTMAPHGIVGPCAARTSSHHRSDCSPSRRSGCRPPAAADRSRPRGLTLYQGDYSFRDYSVSYDADGTQSVVDREQDYGWTVEIKDVITPPT